MRRRRRRRRRTKTKTTTTSVKKDTKKDTKKDEIPTGKSVGKAKVGIYDIFWRYNERKSSAKSATPRRKKRVVTKRATTATTKVAKPQTSKPISGTSFSLPQAEKILQEEFARNNVQQLVKQLNDLITIVSMTNGEYGEPTAIDRIHQAARAKFNTGLVILKTIDPKNPMMRYYKTRNIVWTLQGSDGLHFIIMMTCWCLGMGAMIVFFRFVCQEWM